MRTSSKPFFFGAIVISVVLADILYMVGGLRMKNEPDVARSLMDFASIFLLFGWVVHFPQPRPIAVAAPGIGSDQESTGPGIDRSPHLLPPPPDARHGELGGVVVDSDA